MMSTVNAELYGMRHRRAFTVLPIVWLLQIILFAYVANFIVAMTVEDLSGLQREAMLASLTTESASAAVLGSLPMYGAPVLIILGALMAAETNGPESFASPSAEYPSEGRCSPARSRHCCCWSRSSSCCRW